MYLYYINIILLLLWLVKIKFTDILTYIVSNIWFKTFCEAFSIYTFLLLEVFRVLSQAHCNGREHFSSVFVKRLVGFWHNEFVSSHTHVTIMRAQRQGVCFFFLLVHCWREPETLDAGYCCVLCAKTLLYT